MKEQKLKEVFSKVYQDNLWGEETSSSGPGSNLEQTEIIRPALIQLINKYNIKTIIDAPCGDLNWMIEVLKNTENDIDSYTGIDIVEDLIVKNRERYGSEKVNFLNIDLIKDAVMKVDLILTRDCFLHLSFFNTYKILKNYKKSKSTFILISTYDNHDRKNKNTTGFYVGGRALNMQNFPFSLPDPIMLINEGCTEGGGAYSDKSLALWKTEQIPLTKILVNIALSQLIKYPYNIAKYIYKSIRSK
jgi:hypothetical protein